MRRTIVVLIFGVAIASMLVVGLDFRNANAGLVRIVQAKENGCSLQDIQGTYAYTLTGFLTEGPGAGPSAAVGRLTFDGEGNIFGRDTVSVNGQVTRGRTYSGTYVVNEDCTYSTTIIDSLGQYHFGDYVIVDQNEVRGIRADDANVVTLNLKRTTFPPQGLSAK